MPDDTAPQRIVCGVSCWLNEAEDRIAIPETDRHTTTQAIDLASRSGGQIVFVHVVDWMSEDTSEDGAAVVDEVREQLRPDLEEVSAKAEAKGVPHRHEMRLGKPWKELLRVADDEAADVIVVSPRRQRTSLGQRIFHGRTATRILKESTCPVWVVEPDCALPRRILALLDLSEVSEMVVAAARQLARLYDAELYGLYCLDYPSDIALQRLPGARKAIEKYHRDARVDARERLAALTEGDENWHLLLGEDWVARLAPRVIDEKKIDLVVMGGVSKPRLAGALLGTTAQRLLDHVSASTWMVRPERQGPPAHRSD